MLAVWSIDENPELHQCRIVPWIEPKKAPAHLHAEREIRSFGCSLAVVQVQLFHNIS